MNQVDVIYSVNKAGLYIQFRWAVSTMEIEELTIYDKAFRKDIEELFDEVMAKFDLDFASDSSYLVQEDGEQYMVICLLGKATPELEKVLQGAGVERREFL